MSTEEKETGKKDEHERGAHRRSSPPQGSSLDPRSGPCTPHHGATAATACCSHPHGSGVGPGAHSPQAGEENPLRPGRGSGGEAGVGGSSGREQRVGWLELSTMAATNPLPNIKNAFGSDLSPIHTWKMRCSCL